ncbi:hypothetical protein GCM10009841_09920 [Microlunatus panaciterrae]
MPISVVNEGDLWVVVWFMCAPGRGRALVGAPGPSTARSGHLLPAAWGLTRALLAECTGWSSLATPDAQVGDPCANGRSSDSWAGPFGRTYRLSLPRPTRVVDTRTPSAL